MVRKLFSAFFSRRTGPARIRMQMAGTPSRRFYKIVTANARDPTKGKHMEVLGSYVPGENQELRLRFSRVKFWLAAGAQINHMMGTLLGYAGLICSPPPIHGRRTCGHHLDLYAMRKQDMKQREDLSRSFLMQPRTARLALKQSVNGNVEGLDDPMAETSSQLELHNEQEPPLESDEVQGQSASTQSGKKRIYQRRFLV